MLCPLALMPPEGFLQGDGVVPGLPVKPGEGSLSQPFTTAIPETFLHPSGSQRT